MHFLFYLIFFVHICYLLQQHIVYNRCCAVTRSHSLCPTALPLDPIPPDGCESPARDARAGVRLPPAVQVPYGYRCSCHHHWCNCWYNKEYYSDGSHCHCWHHYDTPSPIPSSARLERAAHSTYGDIHELQSAAIVLTVHDSVQHCCGGMSVESV